MINKELFISALVKDRKMVRFDASVLIQCRGRHSVDWPNCELAHNVDLTSDVMMRPPIFYLCPNNLYDNNDPG